MLKGGRETSSPPGGVPIQDQNIQAEYMGTVLFQMETYDSKVPSLRTYRSKIITLWFFKRLGLKCAFKGNGK